MTRTRRAISLFLLWHVMATALGSIPPAERLDERRVGPVRHPEDDPIAAVVTPHLDALAGSFWQLAKDVSSVAGATPAYARLYLRSVGLGQPWQMFSSPPTRDEYMRIRYFVGASSNDTPSWAATALVFPASREDQVRLGRAYWDKHRDKAVYNANRAFVRRLHDETEEQSVGESAAPPTDLAPIVRYFTRLFRDERLAPTERVLRAEFWYGSVPNLPRGTPVHPGVREARLAALQRYYEGPVEHRLDVPPYGPVNAFEREADITWSLQYFEGY